MTITNTPRPTAELEQDLLDDLRRLAAGDDSANRFFDETHRRLVDAGHYVANVPTDLGGHGLGLFETARRQRLLARYAPAAALASCMHLYWTGSAAELQRNDVHVLDFVLEAAQGGTIFASGHAEPGNDVSTLMSTTVAEPVPGGYRITGRKNFGSLGPIWDQIGFHAMDSTDPEAPEVIHGFASRTDPGVRVIENWDTISMRASQSHDTTFDAVFVPHERIIARHPAGDGNEPVTATAFFWALILISNVYLGIAERAIEIAAESLSTKTAIAMDGRTLAHNPMHQHQIAEMWISLDGLASSLDMLATEWSDDDVDHGSMWEVKLFAVKHRASTIVRSVVDTATEVVGGGAIRSDHELSRLLRDSRAAAYHPASDALAHEAIGKAVLGIGPEGPRW